MHLGKDKTKHPAQPIAKLNVPDADRQFQKTACHYFNTWRGILHELLSIYHNICRVKGRVEILQSKILPDLDTSATVQ